MRAIRALKFRFSRLAATATPSACPPYKSRRRDRRPCDSFRS
ncbi:putative signal peptide protein [Halorubrum sp. AJ67]|nr:putative signal peptide protein [Halorubrum sp. AJ67]